MSNKIQLHKNDLPDDLNLGNIIAVDGEFMGLNVRRDPLCLIQLSSGNSDAHIVQFDRESYQAPNLVKILNDENIKKIFHYGRADMAHIKFYLKTLPFTILSLISGLLLYMYDSNLFTNDNVILFIFIIISSLTLPHVFIMKDFVKDK